MKKTSTVFEKIIKNHETDENNAMNKLTLKEKLTIKADEYNKNIDIAEHIKDIKCGLEGYFYKREYVVSLIKVTKSPVAMGHYSVARTNIFIPNGVAPLHYRQLFVNELQKLGFSEECMELSVEEHSCFNSYNIKLK